MFEDLTMDDNIQGEVDRLGGNAPLETNLYLGKIKSAYGEVSEGGARGVNLTVDIDGREYRETLWVISGKAKGCKNYYENKDGERNYLPGYLTAGSSCKLVAAKELNQMDIEEKVVNVYNFELKKDVPTAVNMLVDLLDQEVALAIRKVRDNKNVKVDGQYVPTNEAREFNEIVKVFQADTGLTSAELDAQETEGAFVHQWKEKFAGVTLDKFKEVKGAPQAGSPGGKTGAPKSERKSLFGKTA